MRVLATRVMPKVVDVVVVLVASPVIEMVPLPLVVISEPPSQMTKSSPPASPVAPKLPDRLMLPPPAWMAARLPDAAPMLITFSSAEVKAPPEAV